MESGSDIKGSELSKLIPPAGMWRGAALVSDNVTEFESEVGVPHHDTAYDGSDVDPMRTGTTPDLLDL